MKSKAHIPPHDNFFVGEEEQFAIDTFDDGCFFIRSESRDLDADLEELYALMYTVRIKDI